MNGNWNERHDAACDLIEESWHRLPFPEPLNPDFPPAEHVDRAIAHLRAARRSSRADAARSFATAAAELYWLAAQSYWGLDARDEIHMSAGDQTAEHVDGLGFGAAVDWCGFPRLRARSTLIDELLTDLAVLRTRASKFDPTTDNWRKVEAILNLALDAHLKAFSYAVLMDPQHLDGFVCPTVEQPDPWAVPKQTDL